MMDELAKDGARRSLVCSRDISGSKSLKQSEIRSIHLGAPDFCSKLYKQANGKDDCIAYQLPPMLFYILICPVRVFCHTLAFKFLPLFYSCVKKTSRNKHYKQPQNMMQHKQPRNNTQHNPP